MAPKKLTDAEKLANVRAGLTPTGKLRTKRDPRKKKFPLRYREDPDDYRLKGRQTAFTPARKNRYLHVLREHGDKALARADVGVLKSTVSDHRGKDPVFRDAEDEALRLHASIYTKEMRRRAVDGVQEPVYGAGGPGSGSVVVGFKTVYSDRLLLELARRYEPEFTPRTRVESTVKDITPPDLGLRNLSPASRAQLREILEREAALNGRVHPDSAVTGGEDQAEPDL